MKYLKPIIRLAVLLLLTVCAQTAKAQMYIMVHKTDGDVLKIAVSDVDSVTFREWTGPIFSYEYVDLGLSVQWATCNVGAQSPEQTGGYFAWGETEEKDSYFQKNYKFFDSNIGITKYNVWESNGKVDMKYRLDPEDDAATALLGEGWRTPTREELQELMNDCSWSPAMMNGVQGYRVVSQKNNNSIFIPLTGERWQNDTIGYNKYAYYYSNTNVYEYVSNNVYAAYMYYNSTDGDWYESTYNRIGGLAIRPVYSIDYPANVIEAKELSINTHDIRIEVGESVELNASVILQDGSTINPLWKSSNSLIARVDNGTVFGTSAGKCMIYASFANFSDSCLVTVVDIEDVKEYVNLGLSVNWATCNIGASKPERVGLYYAWGESEIKADYDWDNYKYGTSEGYMTKYCTNPAYGLDGFVDSLSVLEPDDDAAHVLWGGDWRMPTYAEITELIENCDFDWVEWKTGEMGYLVTSRVPGYEQNSIFLPYSQDMGGVCIWTSTANLRQGNYAYLLFENTNRYIYARCNGLPVRPVCPNTEYEYVKPTLELSNETLTIVEGQTAELKALYNSMSVSEEAVWTSSDTTVAVVNGFGYITAIAQGTCTITATYNGQSATCAVTVTERGQIGYVDLGLSVNWATCNLGAMSPEEDGYYYAWGAIDTTSTYSWETYRFFTGYIEDEGNQIAQVSKYLNNSYYGENVDNLTVLESADDVASVKWGGNWRIPTRAEIEELINLCEWEWTEYDGVYGYKVTSRVTGFMDRSIFLPEYFWSSSLFESNALGAYALAGQSIGAYYRKAGLAIRPVYTFDVSEIEGLLLDKSIVSLALGSEVVVNATPYNADGRAITVNGALNITWTSGDADVATVTDGKIKAVGVGKCVITATYDGETYEVSVTVEDPSQAEPESVDLGLSVKWATFNVGSFAPEMIGDFFAWGEVEPYYEAGYSESADPVWKDGKSEGYAWPSYQWAELVDSASDNYSVTKYGKDGNVVLEDADDAAIQAWGGKWRMPDTDEFRELMYLCNWEFVVVNGVKGYRVTSNVDGYTDKSIFLPLTNSRSGSKLNSDTEGYYWSRNVNEGNPITAWYLYIDEGNQSVWNYYRYQGRTVRPVCPSDSWQGITAIDLDSTSTSIASGTTDNLTYSIHSGNQDYSFLRPTGWKSSDETVITVDADGTLHAMKEGSATITAYYNELTSECVVTVKKLSEIDPEQALEVYNAMYTQLGKPMSCGFNNPDDFGLIMVAYSTDIEASDMFLPNSGYNWFSVCGELSSRNISYRNGVIRYNACYNVIKAANLVLCSYDENSSNPEVQAKIGEAYAIRAFAYLNLAPYYQVSYTSSAEAKNLLCVPILTPDTPDPSNNPRATLQEVYDLILSDLGTAIEKLEGWQRVDKSRIDQQVAYGLRARAYLNMGLWSQAADDAEAALDGYAPASISDVSTPFLYDLSESNWMWGYDMTEKISGLFTYATSSAWLRSFSGSGYSTGCQTYAMINSDLYDLIPSTDVRKGWWVNENLTSPLLNRLVWDDLKGQEIASEVIGGTKEQFLPYTNVKFGMKYPGNEANDEDWCWMRAEEMILIMVEGLAKSGHAEDASDILTYFVQKYRDPSYDIEGRGLYLEDEIWFQRRVELWGEGFSNNDLRRLNKPLVRFHEYKENNCPAGFRRNMSTDNGWWLMRFPTAVINQNPALVNNDGGYQPEDGNDEGLLDGITD